MPSSRSPRMTIFVLIEAIARPSTYLLAGWREGRMLVFHVGMTKNSHLSYEKLHNVVIEVVREAKWPCVGYSSSLPSMKD